MIFLKLVLLQPERIVDRAVARLIALFLQVIAVVAVVAVVVVVVVVAVVAVVILFLAVTEALSSQILL